VYDDDLSDVLLEPRIARPTGQLKECVICGDQIISGYKCADCVHSYQRASFERHGKRYTSGNGGATRKFSPDQVREIRNDGRTDSRFVKEMSQKYNVRPETIYSILVRDTYKDVED
jgi:hypothetical protein